MLVLALCLVEICAHFCVYLHEIADVLTVGKNLAETLGAEYVTQSGLREEARRVVSIGHVDHRDHRVEHVVVDDRVHGHRHRVFRQNLPVTAAVKYRRRRRRRSEMTSAGECLYARILYSKIKYK